MSEVVIVAIVALLSAAIGAGFKAWTDRGVNQTDSWAKLAESYSRQIADMAKSYGEIEARLDRVEVALDREEKRSNDAIRYICLLRKWIYEKYPGSDLPEVPESIRDDVL